MWIRELLLGLVGLASGFAVAAGVFGFIVVLGVVPRIAGKTHTSNKIVTYENTIFLGGMLGNLVSLFKIPLADVFPMSSGVLILGLFGLCAGIYTGCLAMALAEILDAFPIMFRRAKIKMGLGWILVAVSFGKVIGAFYYYANHMELYSNMTQH